MTETSTQKQTKLLKVVLVGNSFINEGDSGVGKTNILSRYINNKFLLAQAVTIGV
jgi:GTPase SAR1 family protein